MARKLKSDKVLFITTILLVALSVVMVYSASAPMALDRYGRATRFLTTQAMWAVLGFAMLTLVMRIDYRHYREPMVIWSGLGFVAFALVLLPVVYFLGVTTVARLGQVNIRGRSVDAGDEPHPACLFRACAGARAGSARGARASAPPPRRPCPALGL